MNHIITKLSAELSRNNIFHRVEMPLIRTRRSIVKIPQPNNDIAYLLGAIRGDGSLTKSRRKKGGYHYTFRIYSGDKKYLVYINTLFSDLFSLKGKIIRDKRKNNSYYLVLKNSIIFFYFALLGSQIGKKIHGKIPDIVNKNKKYQLNYLAGLIDTDGHISRNRIQLKQKSLELLEGINKIANKRELNCSEPKINYTKDIPFYYIRFDNKLPLRLKTNNFLNIASDK